MVAIILGVALLVAIAIVCNQANDNAVQARMIGLWQSQYQDVLQVNRDINRALYDAKLTLDAVQPAPKYKVIKLKK